MITFVKFLQKALDSTLIPSPLISHFLLPIFKNKIDKVETINIPVKFKIYSYN